MQMVLFQKTQTLIPVSIHEHLSEFTVVLETYRYNGPSLKGHSLEGTPL